MNWLNDFYSKQYIWSVEQEVFDPKDLRYDLVNKLTPYEGSTILDLGSGLGQFAIAAALKGYHVTALELTDEGIYYTKKIAEEFNVQERITIIQGDFYNVNLAQTFDFVCYWDGFGIGNDEDQITLLSRISDWLANQGTALIDIYTPWYWAKVAGEQMKLNGIERRYDFDALNCRMNDTWWLQESPDEKVTQSLRCYSPADLKLLLKNINLELQSVEPGGAMNYDTWEYHEQVSLHEAMQYLAILNRVRS